MPTPSNLPETRVEWSDTLAYINELKSEVVLTADELKVACMSSRADDATEVFEALWAMAVHKELKSIARKRPRKDHPEFLKPYVIAADYHATLEPQAKVSSDSQRKLGRKALGTCWNWIVTGSAHSAYNPKKYINIITRY